MGARGCVDLMRWDVALNLFYEDTTPGADGHGFTTSGRFTIEASTAEEAIVLACEQEFADGMMPLGHRIGSAAPTVTPG